MTPNRKDIRADKDGWMHDPYTEGARRFYEKRCAAELRVLIRAAERSSDMNVVRYYERYRALQQMLVFLSENEQEIQQ